MAEAQRGDVEAYRALLEYMRRELVSFLRARVSNPQDVADLYQETFLALHRARHSYKPLRPVEPWLLAIAGHVVARHMRRHRTRKGREIPVDLLPGGGKEDNGPGGVPFAQALDHLRPTHREAIELVK